MTTTRALIPTLLAVTVLATAGGGVAHPARADGVAQRMDAPATCPPDVARNSALGVALTLPPQWEEAAPGKFPPGELGLQIPAPPGRPDNDGRLDIASWGTTTDRDDARAAAAGMNRLLKGFKAPVTRVPVRYGGAPGVLVRGLPTGVTAIVLAHAGAVYKILAPGKSLAPDQRQALASLRFIPRVGPFPPAVPPAPSVAAPPPPSLLLTIPRTGRSPVLTVRATGSGYRPGEAVELHACWTGVPRPGIRGVRYTWYWLFAIAHVNRAGLLDAELTVPVSPQAYVSYMVRVLANDARIGNRLVTAAIHLPGATQGAPARITLRISPDHVALGQRFTVTLSGARPGEVVFFAIQPRHSTGSSGGNMGRYGADRAGIVRFTYPPFTRRWELGQWVMTAWVVTAQRRGAGKLASATLTVVPARAAAPDVRALRLLSERTAGGCIRSIPRPRTPTGCWPTSPARPTHCGRPADAPLATRASAAR